MTNSLRKDEQRERLLTDAELVAEIRGGKEHLFNELYNRYSARVYHKCLGMVKEKNLAKDLAHDVFIKVFTHLDNYKGTADLSFWIYAITYNHCISHLRKAKKMRFDPIDEVVNSEDDGEASLTEKIVKDLRITQLDRLLKGLSPEEEVILLMRYQDGLAVKQIAAILKIGESAVKMRLKRCRAKLASQLNTINDES